MAPDVTGDGAGRLRVLWLIKGLGAGGAERLLVSAARCRDRERFDYQAAYLLAEKSAFVPQLEGEGVPVQCLEAGSEWHLGWALRLRRRLLDQPVDVVHVHSPYVAGITRLLLRTLPRRHRPALVATEHVPWCRYAPPTRLLNSVTHGLDDADLAVSEEVRDSVSPRRRAAVETLVHGVVLDAIRPLAAGREAKRKELGLGPEEVVVGTVSNYRPQKGYPDLLAAARRVIDTGVPVRFLAIGQGPLEGEIRRQHTQLDLGERFLLLGASDDPAGILAACDMFVLASHYEGYPIAVMEAMAVGLPVVATAVGGVAEAVRDGIEGLLVPPMRPDLLAAAVASLSADPDRRARMSAAAVARSDLFDMARAVRRVEEIYEELVRARGGRASPAEEAGPGR